jgi:hypothetical protein
MIGNARVHGIRNGTENGLRHDGSKPQGADRGSGNRVAVKEAAAFAYSDPSPNDHFSR